MLLAASKPQRRTFAGLIVISLCAFLFARVPPASAQEPQRVYKIGVVQMTNVEIVYGATFNGFYAELQKLGYIRGENLEIIRRVALGPTKGIWDRAQLYFALQGYIDEFASKDVDLVVTIGTPATKFGAELAHEKNLPVMFMGVSMPATIEFLDEGWITGTSTFFSPERLLRLMRGTMPTVSKLGMTVSDDANAVAFARHVHQSADELGFEIIRVDVFTNEDAYRAARVFIDEGIQAYLAIPDTWIGRDDAVNAEVLLQEAFRQMNIPVVAAYPEAIQEFPEDIALAVGVPFRRCGEMAAPVADRILRGDRPGSIPVQYSQLPEIKVNVEVARRTGIPITPALLNLAETVRN